MSPRPWHAGGLAVLCCLLSAPAQAEEPAVWTGMYDGRLSESLDRDPGAAEAIYEALLTHQPDDDPLRPELLYWLGRARAGNGDLDGAAEALALAATDPVVHDRARSFEGLLGRHTDAVEVLPFRQDFSSGKRPWVRGWPRGLSSDLSVEPVDGDPVLQWAVQVRDGEDDFILLPLDLAAGGPQRIKLAMRAEQFPAHVRVLVEDKEGARWTASVIEVPSTQWRTVELPLAAFAPADAPAARRSPNPSAIQALILRDVTAYHSSARGINRLSMDNIDLR